MTLQRKFWVEVSRCSYLSSRTNYSQKWAWCYFTFAWLRLAGLHIWVLSLANTLECVKVSWGIITQRFAGLNLIRTCKNIQQFNYLLTGCCHGEMKLTVRTEWPQPVLRLSNSGSWSVNIRISAWVFHTFRIYFRLSNHPDNCIIKLEGMNDKLDCYRKPLSIRQITTWLGLYQSHTERRNSLSLGIRS